MPVIKNGANGMYFWCLAVAHTAPVTHATINASDTPWTPAHTPPVAISLISPMPIGVLASGFFQRRTASNTKPVPAANAYPNAAPIAAPRGPTGQTNQFVINNPISINGHRNASGIIRRRKSAREICHAHHNAMPSKIMKKICQIIFFPLAFRFGTVIELYHKKYNRG